MNTFRATLFGFVVLFTSTAATCSKTGGGPTNPVVAGVVDCADQAVHAAALHVVDDVNSALATGDWQASLVDLVARFGEGAVTCAVAEVYSTATKHAKFDSLEGDKASRAKQWLDSHPVKTASWWPRPGSRLAYA